MDVTVAGDAIRRALNSDQLSRLSLEFAAFDGEIGTGHIALDDPDADDEYRGGRQLRIDEGTTLLVDGFIGDQDRGRGPVPITNWEHVYSIQDPNALLFAKRAVRSRPSETDVARVLAFAALDLSGVDTTWVLATHTSTLAAKSYDGEGWAELIGDLVAMTGKTLWIHDKAAGGRCLHYHRFTDGHTSGLTITDAFGAADGVTSFIPADPQKQTSPADLGNDVRFVDQDGRVATVTDATSITNHDADGLAHEKIVRVEAKSQAELDAIAASELLETKAERETWLCTIRQLDEDALALIRVGDLITTTSQVMGLSAAAKRIAHMTLTLTKDKKGAPIPGLWDARLELGAPIRRGFKARSLPKPPVPPGPFVPPAPPGVLYCLTPNQTIEAQDLFDRVTVDEWGDSSALTNGLGLNWVPPSIGEVHCDGSLAHLDNAGAHSALSTSGVLGGMKKWAVHSGESFYWRLEGLACGGTRDGYFRWVIGLDETAITSGGADGEMYTFEIHNTDTDWELVRYHLDATSTPPSEVLATGGLFGGTVTVQITGNGATLALPSQGYSLFIGDAPIHEARIDFQVFQVTPPFDFDFDVTAQMSAIYKLDGDPVVCNTAEPQIGQATTEALAGVAAGADLLLNYPYSPGSLVVTVSDSPTSPGIVVTPTAVSPADGTFELGFDSTGMTVGVTYRIADATPTGAVNEAPLASTSATVAGDPATDTSVWMPLTTVVGGVPDLVWDGDDSLIPTLTPL